MRGLIANASNRLTQIQVGDDDEASKVVYLHNAAGQRVFKSEPQVAQTAPSEEQLGTDFITWLKKNFGWLFAQAQQNATLGQSFVYGDDPIGSYNLLGEYGNGGSKSAGRMEYIYLPTETGTALLIGLYKNNRFYAVHTDHLGTPRSITDDTNKVVWQWAYSAFGDNKPTGILKATTNPKAAITNQPKLLTATSPSLAVNLRFPGQYWDDEAKLSYNYFRSYRPAQGRYDQPDPIGLEGGWSRFGYVEGNPLSWVDPEGLMGGSGSGAAQRNAGSIPIHGSWCGPKWTGGRRDVFLPGKKDPNYYSKPIDVIDSSCLRHDITYAACRLAFPCDKKKRGQCMTQADRGLANDIRFESGLVASAIYLWMNNNTWPDAGENASSCSCKDESQ